MKPSELKQNRYFKIINLPIDRVYTEIDGLRLDLEEVNMQELIDLAIAERDKEIVEMIEKEKSETYTAHYKNIVIQDIINLITNKNN